MHSLNLPPFEHNIRNTEGKPQIFDNLRKKWLVLTPEEWVRQHFVHYLIHYKQYPKSLIKIEGGLKYNTRSNRSDVVVYNSTGEALLLVECKAAAVPLTQQVFDQAARYNHVVKAKYLVITNGLKHFCCEIDHAAGKYVFLQDVPDYG
jgi:hypothetical protein